MHAGIPGRGAPADRRLRLQRPRLGAGAARRSIPATIACVILEAATALAEPAPGLPGGPARAGGRDGFVLIFDEMITGMRWSAGRRPARLRRHARPVHLGQGPRQRLPDLRAGRAARPHGARRAQHRRAPGLPAVDDARTRDDGPRRLPRRRARPTASGTSSATMERRGAELADGRDRGGPATPGLEEYVSVDGPPVLPGVRHPRPEGHPSQAYPHPVPAGTAATAACSPSPS